MSGPSNDLPVRLAEIIEEFQWCEGREKIELLLEYSERMPPLPAWLHKKPELMQEIPECMTPVHVFAEAQANKMKFYFEVPPESPTVRGFATILAEGLDEATPEQVLGVPGDFYQQMGLHLVLTHQRLNGIAAILAHMKQLALRELNTAA